MENFPIVISLETLFRDAYSILEEIHESADHIDPAIAEAIVHCHRTIQMLERIHREQARANSDIEQDIFGLRRNLDRFIGSCHTLSHVGKQVVTSDAVPRGCILLPHPARKSRQIRELQNEFWDHERLLSLALANAVFMTSFDLQRQTTNANPALAAIIRQAEKRYSVFAKEEKLNKMGGEAKSSQSRADELEWELCLRRYFDFVPREINSRSTQSFKSEPDLSRNSSYSSSAVSRPMRRQTSVRTNFSNRSSVPEEHQEPNNLNPANLLQYSNSTKSRSYNEIYTRPRRTSTASTISNISGPARTDSVTEGYFSPKPPGMEVRAQAYQAPSDSIQWEQVPATPNSGHPYSGEKSSLQRALNDILFTTRSMAPSEAHANVQRRLAGLGHAATAQIQQLLDDVNSPPTQNEQLQPPQTNAQPKTLHKGPSKASIAVRGIPSAQADSRYLSRTFSEPALRMHEHKSRRPVELPGLTQFSPQRRVPRKRLSALRSEKTRSLSTIVERPWTAKSKVSSTKSRKSIFSLKQETISPSSLISMKLNSSSCLSVVENATSGDVNLSQENHARRPRIVELDGEEDDYFSLKKKQQQHQLKSTLSKRLPLTPDDLARSPAKKKFGFFGLKKTSKRVLPSSMGSPQLSSAMRSNETLSSVSLDCLRKNGSKSTLCLVTIQEGLEQPFQIWLRALPYIEGRAAPPRV